VDAVQLILGCNAFPPEKLRALAGRHVAWQIDGSDVLASDESPEALLAQLKGVDPESYVLDYVPPLDASVPKT
jgi:hypothetical protein